MRSDRGNSRLGKSHFARRASLPLPRPITTAFQRPPLSETENRGDRLQEQLAGIAQVALSPEL